MKGGLRQRSSTWTLMGDSPRPKIKLRSPSSSWSLRADARKTNREDSKVESRDRHGSPRQPSSTWSMFLEPRSRRGSSVMFDDRRGSSARAEDHTHVLLDANMFPHILDLVCEQVDEDTWLALRATCKYLYNQHRTRVAKHIVITGSEPLHLSGILAPGGVRIAPLAPSLLPSDRSRPASRSASSRGSSRASTPHGTPTHQPRNITLLGYLSPKLRTIKSFSNLMVKQSGPPPIDRSGYHKHLCDNLVDTRIADIVPTRPDRYDSRTGNDLLSQNLSHVLSGLESLNVVRILNGRCEYTPIELPPARTLVTFTSVKAEHCGHRPLASYLQAQRAGRSLAQVLPGENRRLPAVEKIVYAVQPSQGRQPANWSFSYMYPWWALDPRTSKIVILFTKAVVVHPCSAFDRAPLGGGEAEAARARGRYHRPSLTVAGCGNAKCHFCQFRFQPWGFLNPVLDALLTTLHIPPKQDVEVLLVNLPECSPEVLNIHRRHRNYGSHSSAYSTTVSGPAFTGLYNPYTLNTSSKNPTNATSKGMTDALEVVLRRALQKYGQWTPEDGERLKVRFLSMREYSQQVSPQQLELETVF